MKKRIFALLLCIAMLFGILCLTGCNNDEQTPTDYTSVNTCVYRDLPEWKYIEAADSFAGGDGTKDAPYEISNAAELALLGEKLASESESSDYDSEHYILTDDIYLNDVSSFDDWRNTAPEFSWKPIDRFYGVFDGNGKTVYGLYINANCGTVDEYSTNTFGLFGLVFGTVQDLTVSKAYIEVSGNETGVGSVAGGMSDEASVKNCSSDAVFYVYDGTTGGIVGSASGGRYRGVNSDEIKEGFAEIKNCIFSGNITMCHEDGGPYVGGIVGSSDGNISDCVNTGTLSFTATNADSVGGIAGIVGEGVITDCKNEGDLLCKTTESSNLAIAGGIIGKLFLSATGSEDYMSRGVTVKNCENVGTVEGQMYAGGIIGQLSNDHNDYCATVKDCKNNGSVSATDYSGGIIGWILENGDNVNGTNVSVKNCENYADITIGTVGGIVGGLMTETGDTTIDGCINYGNLTADGQHCAGIVAYWVMNSQPSDCSTVIKNCENKGTVTTTVYAGGIVSFMDMPVGEVGDDVTIKISGCSNSGDICSASLNGYIGGILGNWGMKNVPTTVENCNNSGDLIINASGTTVTEDDNEVMTISRIAGGIVGRVGGGLLLTTDHDSPSDKNVQASNAVLKISKCENSGTIIVPEESSEYVKDWFGGIIGNTNAEDGFSVSVKDCSYSGFDRGLGNKDFSDVGTKK